MNDRHLSRVERLRRALLEDDGTLDRASRTAAAAGTLDGELGALVKKVQEHPSTVTDEDVRSLSRKGHTDDALFELIACAAFGAADARLSAAKRAIKGT